MESKIYILHQEVYFIFYKTIIYFKIKFLEYSITISFAVTFTAFLVHS